MLAVSELSVCGHCNGAYGRTWAFQMHMQVKGAMSAFDFRFFW